MFKCVCGKEFKSKHALGGHQGYCKVYLGEDKYLEIINKNKEGQLKAKQTLLNNGKIKKEQELQQWISEKHKCEKCGKVMTEKYASGRFCSKECARGFSNYKGVYNPITKLKNETLKPVMTKDIEISDADYKCPLCDRYYRTEYGVTQHLKKLHNEYYEDNCYVMRDNKSIGITHKNLKEYRKIHTKCEICGKDVNNIRQEHNQFKDLCIDHNHSTNQFRGLLCMTCNRALGWFEKNEQSVLQYLNNNGRENIL